MIEYIINKHKTFDMCALVESHNRGKYNSFWGHVGYKIHNNKAQHTSDRGTHGGEIVACKTNMNSTLIKEEVWDVIRAVSPVAIRVAAMIVKIGKMQFINATAYLNVGEEFSEHNIAVLQQLVMLQNLLNLPIFAYGDYNIDIQDMRDSGILRAHNLQCLEMPGGPSVKLDKRRIDYVLYTGGLKYCIKHICRINKVPYGPHFGCKLTWFGNSNIVGTRIHIPYDMPFLTFEAEYGNMDGESKDQKTPRCKTGSK